MSKHEFRHRQSEGGDYFRNSKIPNFRKLEDVECGAPGFNNVAQKAKIRDIRPLTDGYVHPFEAPLLHFDTDSSPRRSWRDEIIPEIPKLQIPENLGGATQMVLRM